MRKKKRMTALGKAAVAALALIVASSIFATTLVASAGDASGDASAVNDAILHPKADISEITGEGGDPPEILSDASALATEKAWYEYVQYSDEPIGVYALSDRTRIMFYDPYDYSNSLVMETQELLTEWSTANSISVEYNTSDTMTLGYESNTQASSQLEVALGEDVSGGMSDSVSVSKAKSKTNTYNESKTLGKSVSESSEFQWGLSERLTAETSTMVSARASYEQELIIGKGTVETGLETGYSVGMEIGSDQNWTNVTTTDETEENTTDKGYSDSTQEEETMATEKNSAWTKVADRLTKATGSGRSESSGWSTSNGSSITRVFNASYMSEDGSPLSWNIVRYNVVMPLHYKVQYLVDDTEWVTSESAYCLLKTIQGTCRAWQENNQTYVEHWGTGEKVVWDDFWAGFFTKSSLMDAYKDKLYPTNT